MQKYRETMDSSSISILAEYTASFSGSSLRQPPTFVAIEQQYIYRYENLCIHDCIMHPISTVQCHPLMKVISQVQFIESRREYLLGLSQELTTKAGIPVNDVMRFFHGDGPAMQLEAGNKIGGYYNCIGCEAHRSHFDDLAYTVKTGVLP